VSELIVIAHARYWGPQTTSWKRSRIDGLNVYAATIDSETQINGTFSDSKNLLEFTRYLDRYYLVLPVDDNLIRQETVNAFFALIARDYDKTVHVDQNIENINFLFEELRSRLGTLEHKTILDFGCGTGLSLCSTFATTVDLMGIDSCPMMQQIAAHRGHRLITPEDLSFGGLVFDGIICSYVLHLVSDTTSLRASAACLKSGCSIVANFHKGVGVRQITAVLESERFESQQFVSAPLSEHHGVFIAFVKR
jgi:predicted TPR repeat methyltransferase